jgi:hypothetical protein
MLLELPQPWTPPQATERIRSIRLDDDFSISVTRHAKDQMADRDLILSDVLYLLKNGFVFEKADPSTIPHFFKYQIEGKTPNSGSRDVRSVVIPDWRTKEIKIVTVMWKDEPLSSG